LRVGFTCLQGKQMSAHGRVRTKNLIKIKLRKLLISFFKVKIG
jgi:hypothetical protein